MDWTPVLIAIAILIFSFQLGSAIYSVWPDKRLAKKMRGKTNWKNFFLILFFGILICFFNHCRLTLQSSRLEKSRKKRGFAT